MLLGGDRRRPSASRSAAWCCTPCSPRRRRADRRQRAPGPRRADVAALVEAGTLPDPCRSPARRWCRWSTRRAGCVTARSSADRLTPLLRPAELARARRGRGPHRAGGRAGIDRPAAGGRRCRPGPGDRARDGDRGRVQVRDLERSQRVLRPGSADHLPAAGGRAGGDRLAGDRCARCARSRRCARGADARSAATGQDEPAAGAATPPTRSTALAVTLNDMLDRLDGLAGAAARVRRRRRPRAAQPAGEHAHPAGGRPAARRGRWPSCPPTCSPTSTGSPGWSTTCCCWPGPTPTSRAPCPARVRSTPCRAARARWPAATPPRGCPSASPTGPRWTCRRSRDELRRVRGQPASTTRSGTPSTRVAAGGRGRGGDAGVC